MVKRYWLSVIDLINFREDLLIFWGIWGEAKLILRIWGAKENIFGEQRYFLSGSWGDQCIIFRDQGSTDPPPPSGASKMSPQCTQLKTISQFFLPKLKLNIVKKLSSAATQN